MGSSSSRYVPPTPRPVESFIEPARERTETSDYESAIASRLSDLLAEYNQRDVDTTNERLDEIQGVLTDYLESSVALRFGGSVSKHTYIDGLSDIDCLLFLNPSQFSAESPSQLLDEFAQILRDALGAEAEVSRGELAVTVSYEDGTKLQLLPALGTSTGVRISASGGERWSHVVHPERFATALTAVNQRLQGRVVPVIKLAKAAIADLNLPVRMEGYHIEALAVRVFQEYQGPASPKAMLQHFFDRASELVRTPIGDLTGQSVYVDEYLGPRNAPQRANTAQALAGISIRMGEADSHRSEEEWLRAIDTLS